MRQISKLMAATALSVAPVGLGEVGAVAADNDGDQVITIQVENDLLFNTDEDYTNGLRIGLVHRPGKTPFADDVSDLLRRYSPLADDAPSSDIYYSLALGQNMYTPGDIATSDLITDDRPYAGWLYLEFGVTRENPGGYEVAKLDLGVVGPASLAGKTQRWWHGVIGIGKPEGWEHQLPNEPGINLYYSRGYRFATKAILGSLQADVTPHWGVALGNVHTYGAGGLTVRLGTNLNRDKGAPPRIQPSLPGSDHFSGDDDFDMYLFAGGEVRAVARNIFLDGTWRGHEHHVDKKTFLAEVQVGMVLFLGRTRFALTNAFRTSEFEGSGNHRYSALTMSLRF
ncbi:MAG: lipid A deacylase LpxR family protein [Alphaproteobacteria bacterium]|nr:lipid A deacylase LpxR family protein [Alphaproteobacteria bacterium]